jgi:hypothetical protein
VHKDTCWSATGAECRIEKPRKPIDPRQFVRDAPHAEIDRPEKGEK